MILFNDVRRHLPRHGAAAGLALAVTAALVLLMQHLIQPEDDGISEPPRGGIVTFEPALEDEPVDPEPPRPVPPEPPPPEPEVRFEVTIDGGDGRLEVGNPVPADEILDPTVPQGVPDGELLSIVKVPDHHRATAIAKEGNNFNSSILGVFIMETLIVVLNGNMSSVVF